MPRSLSTTSNIFMLIISLACTCFSLSAPANAQMANNPWAFQPQNRASVAALIRQVEREKNNSTGVIGTNAASLSCGSDGKSAASANSTCIILNNSTGHVEIGQDAQGDQTATGATDTQTNVHPSTTDDVLATLTGSSK